MPAATRSRSGVRAHALRVDGSAAPRARTGAEAPARAARTGAPRSELRSPGRARARTAQSCVVPGRARAQHGAKRPVAGRARAHPARSRPSQGARGRDTGRLPGRPLCAGAPGPGPRSRGRARTRGGGPPVVRGLFGVSRLEGVASRGSGPHRGRRAPRPRHPARPLHPPAVRARHAEGLLTIRPGGFRSRNRGPDAVAAVNKGCPAMCSPG